MKDRKKMTDLGKFVVKSAQEISVLGLGTVLLLMVISCCTTQPPLTTSSKVQATTPRENTTLNVDAAWQETKDANTKEAFISFVRKYRDTQYTPYIMEQLEKYAMVHTDYAISKIRAPNNDTSLKNYTNVKITKQDSNGELTADGRATSIIDQATGELVSMFWYPGAEHTILCVLTLEGYTILSDAKNPLVFQTTTDRGYTYKEGHGLVIEPDGALVSLGAAK